MGTLYVIGTPLGNSADMSARAVELLSRLTHLACEDTRSAHRLLIALRITSSKSYISLYQEKEQQEVAHIIALLQAGNDVGLMSEAGMPAISDPGAFVVAAAHREGNAVVCVPGPSAVTAALSVSGFEGARFLFVGFLPKKTEKAIDSWETQSLERPYCVVCFESPYRIHETIAAIARHYPQADLCVARNLTKKDELVVRGKTADLALQHFATDGEYTLVVLFSRGRLML